MGEHLLRMFRGRAFGTTSRAFIRTFPATAQIGDQICVILGSATPVLVRPVPDSEDQYRLVGQCYVARLMNGEALLDSLPDS
jgi:hypothetical protein